MRPENPTLCEVCAIDRHLASPAKYIVDRIVKETGEKDENVALCGWHRDRPPEQFEYTNVRLNPAHRPTDPINEEKP
jgi:hypothetical protein